MRRRIGRWRGLEGDLDGIVTGLAEGVRLPVLAA
jgi:hypothetical protein